MRNEEDSQRSQSSEGSLNKRAIKSNIALHNKQIQMQTWHGLPAQEEEAKVGDDTEDTAGERRSSALKSTITDEAASEIFDKLTQMQGKKTYYAKKNWTDDEAQLL